MMQESGNSAGATVFQAMRAVLWSFFGISSKAGSEADITRLSMKQVIAFGIFGAVLFVMSLILFVYFVTR